MALDGTMLMRTLTVLKYCLIGSPIVLIRITPPSIGNSKDSMAVARASNILEISARVTSQAGVNKASLVKVLG